MPTSDETQSGPADQTPSGTQSPLHHRAEHNATDDLDDGPATAAFQPNEFSRTFAGRFDHLMQTVPAPHGALWTNAQLADQLTDRGIPTSRNYINQLRTGRRLNPTGRLLGAIADIFAVKVDYFYDAAYAEALNRDLELLATMRAAGLAGIALRATGLSATGMREVERILDSVRRLEGLPDTEPS